MNAREKQVQIDQYPYKEARAKKMECNYFADEVTLVYENNEENDICCIFTGCCKVIFEHQKSTDKWGPIKNMNYGQMPYFVFDIIIGEVAVDDAKFYTCKIDMGLLEMEIWCNDIGVRKIKFIETDGKLCSEF